MTDAVLEGIDPEELEKELPDPWWRKPLLVGIALFLLLMVASLSFLDSLIGIVQSEVAQDAALVFSNATILFTNNTLQTLQTHFLENQHREIKACLFGVREGTSYTVEKIEFPDVIRANVVHVVSVPCKDDVLIDLHSHPIHQCLASAQDLLSYESLKRRNPSARMMVMCSKNRFALV